MISRLLATSLLVLAATPVFADEESAKPVPRLDVEVGVEIGGDYSRDEDGRRFNDTYPTIEMGASWLFTRNLSVQGSFVFEPVIDLDENGETRAFDDLAVYVEEIYGQFEEGPFRLFAGKFNPTFGMAWDKAPGVYGADMAEDYQLTERVGLGGAASLEGEMGKHTLTSSVFFMDTSSLSDSFGARRGRWSTDEGGAGNTERLNNWSVTLDGEDIFGVKGLGYHAGYRFQTAAVPLGEDPAEWTDESGWVVGLNGEHELGSITFGWVAEYADIQNVEGAAGGFDSRWMTFGASLAFDRYNAAVSYTMRDASAGADPTIDDYQLAFSLGTEIHDGWTADVGYKILEEDNLRSDTVGFRIGKSFEFSSAD